jgi:sulfonate transport system substrate-binding protein
MKNRILRSIVAGTTAVSLIAALGLTSSAATEKKQAVNLSNVTLRVESTITDAVFKAAGQANTPYKIQSFTYTSGALALQQMAADQLDFTASSEIPPLFASLSQGGGNFKVVATNQSNNLLQDLIIGPNSKIKSVKELKGKKVGYVKATTAQYFLVKMLKSAGLTWKDIQPVNLSPSDGLSALIAGDISAFAVFGNPITTNAKQGGKILASAKNILSGSYYFEASVLALKDPGKTAAILDYLQRIEKVYKWERKNLDKYATIQAPLNGMTKEQFIAYAKAGNAQRLTRVRATTDSDFMKWQDVSNVLYGVGVLEKKVRVRTLYSNALESKIKKLLG